MMRAWMSFVGTGFSRTCIAATLVFFVVTYGTAAQQPQSRISPHEQTSGVIDGAHLKVTYGRPSMRGRAIFGALVPYDRVWCPGADEATVGWDVMPSR